MLKSFAAGGAAGAASKTMIAPFDRVKILFQVSNVRFTYKGVAEELRRTVKLEGVRALFKGNAAQVLRVYPYSGTQLMAYDQFAQLLLAYRQSQASRSAAAVHTHTHTHGPRLAPTDKLIAGAAAGAVSVIVTYPLDLMRARLAVQTIHDQSANGTAFRSLAHAFRHMYAAHGWRSFYRGMAPTLAGMAPYAGISFAINETLKQFVLDTRPGDTDIPVHARLVCGGIAGLVGQGATYPLDVIRRRMQTEGFTVIHAHSNSTAAAVGTAATDAVGAAGAASTASAPMPSIAVPASSAAPAAHAHGGGMLHTARRIVASEGVRGLFKGFSMNLIKGPLGVGFSFTLYDLLKQALGVQDHALR